MILVHTCNSNTMEIEAPNSISSKIYTKVTQRKIKFKLLHMSLPKILAILLLHRIKSLRYFLNFRSFVYYKIRHILISVSLTYFYVYGRYIKQFITLSFALQWRTASVLKTPEKSTRRTGHTENCRRKKFIEQHGCPTHIRKTEPNIKSE